MPMHACAPACCVITTACRVSPQDCTLLSADVIDLLDRMFELDEHARIGIDDISAHRWMQKPLPPLYANAYEQLDKEQAIIDKQVGCGTRKSSTGCCGGQRGLSVKQGVQGARSARAG